MLRVIEKKPSPPFPTFERLLPSDRIRSACAFRLSIPCELVAYCVRLCTRSATCHMTWIRNEHQTHTFDQAYSNRHVLNATEILVFIPTGHPRQGHPMRSHHAPVIPRSPTASRSQSFTGVSSSPTPSPSSPSSYATDHPPGFRPRGARALGRRGGCVRWGRCWGTGCSSICGYF